MIFSCNKNFNDRQSSIDTGKSETGFSGVYYRGYGKIEKKRSDGKRS